MLGVLACTVSLAGLCGLASAAPFETDGCLSGQELVRLADARNLTFTERQSLDDICVPKNIDLKSSIQPRLFLRDGIPDGVDCTPEKWCDSQGVCSIICSAGSVKIDPWYTWAATWQRNISEQLPLCYASILGSHNSAITLANGYGNEDPYWQSFFKYIPSMDGARLRTNNQWLSITDQLNLGVRLVEIDTHWIIGRLRVGHCGGLHSPMLNALIRALNTLSKLFGQRVHWDTETLGCSPCLSAIPTKDQRPFADTLAEVRAWMDRPENAAEVVFLFLDDEKDLKTWGKVGLVINELLDSFPAAWLLTPPEKELLVPGVWPTIAELRALGKRLVVLSRRDYGRVMHSHIFPRTPCGWTEPQLHETSGPPTCAYTEGGNSQDGVFYRVNDCKLVYGPLNCNFVPASAADDFDNLTEEAIAASARCAWNSISPDLLTPETARKTIWSWAEGFPRPPSGRWRGAQAPLAAVGDAWEGGTQVRRDLRAEAIAPEGAAVVQQCAVIHASDWRWRTTDCAAALPVACRRNVPFGGGREGRDLEAAPSGAVGGGGLWVLGGLGSPAQLQAAPLRPSPGTGAVGLGSGCPEGYAFEFPRTGKENMALGHVMEEHEVERVLLNLQGPLFAPAR